MAEIAEVDVCYVLVGNIPSKFRSVDLRSFFSQFVETGKFECFHFRHRPEVLKRKTGNEFYIKEDIITDDFIKGRTTCCVVRLKKENVEELLENYDGENWTDKNGKLSAHKAVVSRIVVKSSELCKYKIIYTIDLSLNYVKANTVFNLGLP